MLIFFKFPHSHPIARKKFLAHRNGTRLSHKKWCAKKRMARTQFEYTNESALYSAGPCVGVLIYMHAEGTRRMARRLPPAQGRRGTKNDAKFLFALYSFFEEHCPSAVCVCVTAVFAERFRRLAAARKTTHGSGAIRKNSYFGRLLRLVCWRLSSKIQYVFKERECVIKFLF